MTAGFACTPGAWQGYAAPSLFRPQPPWLLLHSPYQDTRASTMIVDDYSTKSTVTVEAAVKEFVETAEKPSRRRVQFGGDDFNTFYSNRHISLDDSVDNEENEQSSTWFSEEDYSGFRKDRRHQLREISRAATNSSFSDLFEAVYEKAQEAADEGSADAADIFSSEQMIQLSDVFNRTEHLDLVGLERYVTPFAKLEAANRQKSLHFRVADIQDEHDVELWTKDEVQEELSEACHEVTQTDKIVAQVIAKARARADSP